MIIPKRINRRIVLMVNKPYKYIDINILLGL